MGSRFAAARRPGMTAKLTPVSFRRDRIRVHTTIDKLGWRRERHAGRFLKTPEEMRRLFPRYEDAVRCTAEFAARCKFSLDDLTYTYPTERLDDG
jgi:error-prone DNA polymerase